MRAVPDEILNIRLQKKFKDRIRNVYPVTHSDNVMLGNSGNEMSLTDKLKSTDKSIEEIMGILDEILEVVTSSNDVSVELEPDITE